MFSPNRLAVVGRTRETLPIVALASTREPSCVQHLVDAECCGVHAVAVATALSPVISEVVFFFTMLLDSLIFSIQIRSAAMYYAQLIKREELRLVCLFPLVTACLFLAFTSMRVPKTRESLFFLARTFTRVPCCVRPLVAALWSKCRYILYLYIYIALDIVL